MGNGDSMNREGFDEFPSAEEIIEACRVFTTSYFQLGFIPKTSFFERIQKDDVSEFLLLCILCLSARFTPCLVDRYGDAAKATDRFMTAALEKVPHEMYNTNLENVQALFLLSVAEWGNGDRDRSSIHMGVAVRMAAMMKLHREDTYQLPPNATNDQIIFSEAARRTFWMIQSQDNLHSGYSSPQPFSCEDITALLPSEESDFSFGIIPTERAALPSTPPALANPSLVDSPRRSLFATLIQSHSLWGQVARRACRPENAVYGPSSEYINMATVLKRFEDKLPVQHKWSIWSLKVWKDLGFELAYLSIVMMIRLGNILMRRMYLENIKASIPDNLSTSSGNEGPSGFWKTVSEELFENVFELYQQIEASFTMRSQTEGYPAILVFPIYVCGSLALNLWQCPQLCSRLADKAASMLTRCLQVIEELQHAWPMARRWQEGLQQAATPLSAALSPVSARVMPSTPNATGFQRLEHTSPKPNTFSVEEGQTQVDATPNQQLQSRSRTSEASDTQGPHAYDIDALPNDLFDAEVTAFLQGDLHYGLLDEWNHAGFGFN
ncbi:hypothetical protein K505DRAFT_350908 [Melanomma pulvis-pyrius CBS 109.77]|uniref:Xylanolytic transcriptional activator regulatory domain-containing protein n=1 Tax=Melanomma pulvis-pyrius CBS 109.77 TaxID=1314802 RepID=A0A6A6X7Z1_9PLEO|nr:hypothetical protein K505DRAFT_350908 [Melanomma pulvis-pyrius CBS 109.77]